jgi:4-amino-4-deoxy-L-arabinose transferase-like glycosyltransferase
VGKVSKFLILAVIVAFVLRFWHLTSLPFPPDGDEIAYGYYGWSLLHFGTDEYSKILPTSFHSIGDYKYPGLAYINALPAMFFGLSNFTVRFWGATLGVILVILVYLLAQLLFENKKASLFAAWLTALSPWAIVESRLGYENLISSAIVTAGFVCLLYAIKKEPIKKIFIVSSFLFLILASFTHAAPRFFIPAFLLVTIIFSFFKDSIFYTHKKLLIGFFVVIILIISLSLISPENRGRASEDAWQGISGIERNRLQELYIEAGTSQIKIPPRVTWIFHNKYRITLFDYFERYADHFSFNFLFTKGEASLQRIPDMGVLLLIEIILLPFGLVALIKNKSKYSSYLIFLWLLLAPIPSALAIGEARMNRATLMIIPLTIISGLGATYLADLFDSKKRRIIYILLFFGISVSSLYCLNQIFIQKPLDKPWYKQVVNETLTKSILELKDNYKAVATGNDDYIFFLFYGKISPGDFLKRSDILSSSQAKWERVIRLDNIYFKMPFRCPMGGKLNVLYVCEGVEVPQNAKIVRAIFYPDGVPAYSLIEFYPESQMPSKGNLPVLPGTFQYMVDIEHSYPDGIIPDSSKSLW